jgi:hypothetical protein
MNKKNPDVLFTEMLRNDRIGEPDKRIEDRLMYSFMLKNRDNKIRQNSFLGFAGWLFAGHSLGLKAAFVSIVLFFTVFNSQFVFDSTKGSFGGASFTERVLVADSAHFIQPIDSIRNDSLN